MCFLFPFGLLKLQRRPSVLGLSKLSRLLALRRWRLFVWPCQRLRLYDQVNYSFLEGDRYYHSTDMGYGSYCDFTLYVTCARRLGYERCHAGFCFVDCGTYHGYLLYVIGR